MLSLFVHMVKIITINCPIYVYKHDKVITILYQIYSGKRSTVVLIN